MLIRNQRDGSIIASRVGIANNFASRLKGLLGRNVLSKEEGLFIYPCSSIHTFGMKFDIDVMFISKQNRVVKLYHRLNPSRVSKIVKGAWGVIELSGGRLGETGIREGDVIEFSD